MTSELTKKKDGLRFIIYGAGAIGGVVGGNLARTGGKTMLIGRPAQVDAITRNGLRLVTPTGTHTLTIPVVTAPDQIDFRADDVVFLCVKSQDTGTALRYLRAAVEDVPVFCFQNGVRNEETAAGYFPRVYGVRVRMGGVFVSNGEVTARTDPAGSAIIGCYPSDTDGLLEVVAENLRKAGFRVLVTREIMPHKWGQLVGNLANAVSAITNSREEANRRIIEAVRQEATGILNRAGIRWIPGADIDKEWPEGTAIRQGFDTRHQNSTWQSLARRQGTVESEFFNGEIVRLAKRLGMQAPVNEALLRIVQEMANKRELPGKYTPGELLKLLDLG